jgi:hypothetical protein
MIKKIFFGTLGIAILTCAFPVSMALWDLLPAGRYPTILAGLPALPLVWLGLICLRSTGLPVEEFVRTRPRMTGLLICLLALAAWVIGLALGVF